MKRILLGGICTFTLLFGASDSNNIVKKCPDLTIKTLNKDFSNGFKAGIEYMPDVWISYQDILIAYNKTNNIDEFISKEGLEQLTATPIWGEIIAYNNTLMDYKTNNETKKILSEKYKSIIQNINKNDSQWCTNINKNFNLMRTNSKN